MRKPTERVSDWLHEASVLVAIFPMLDKLVTGELSLRWTIGPLAISTILFSLSLLVDMLSELLGW